MWFCLIYSRIHTYLRHKGLELSCFASASLFLPYSTHFHFIIHSDSADTVDGMLLSTSVQSTKWADLAVLGGK